MKKIFLFMMTACVIAQAEMTLEEARKIMKERDLHPSLYFEARQRIQKEITHYEIEEQIVDGYKVGERYKGMSKAGEILETRYSHTARLSKITKENVMRDIKEVCSQNSDYKEYYDEEGEYGGIIPPATICSFSPTTIQKTSWGEKSEVAFPYYGFYVVSFIEVERILQELSTFKVPQNTQLSIYQRAIRTIVQDIYKDMQKVYNDGGKFFELVKNYKTLTIKYANRQITQAMINPLKTSAQQKYQVLSKLQTQKYKLEEQQREEIESRSETKALRAKLDSLYDKRRELEKLYDKKYMEESDLIGKEIGELYDKIPKPQGSPDLDAQIATKEVELSLLVQEIRFLEMQVEIQKVEKMSQAQLTQYVIQHSVCNKKQLGAQESGGASGRWARWCADREHIIADAKKGWYDPSHLFTPLYSPYIPFRGVWEDEEGNRWSEEYNSNDIIIERTFALNDIAQALKENDMPKLLQSLRGFAQFAKDKEDFIYQLVFWLDEKYGQRIE